MLPEILYQIDLHFCYKCMGVFGFLIYMLSYTALQMEWINSDSLSYSIASICAASLVLLSLSAEWNLSTALIQIAWIIIGSVGLWIRWNSRSTASTPTRIARMSG